MYLSASLCSILPPPKHSQSSPTLVICKSGLRIYQKEEIHLFLSPVIDISMIFSKIISPHEILLFPCVFAVVPVKWKYYLAEAALTSRAHWESFYKYEHNSSCCYYFCLKKPVKPDQDILEHPSVNLHLRHCLKICLTHLQDKYLDSENPHHSLSEQPLQPGTNVKHCPTPFKPKLYSNCLNRVGHENKIQLSCLCVFHFISPVINETVKEIVLSVLSEYQLHGQSYSFAQYANNFTSSFLRCFFFSWMRELFSYISRLQIGCSSTTQKLAYSS